MKLLTRSQITQVCIAATNAFARLSHLDLLDLPKDVATCSKTAQAEFWRQRECASLLGVCSFKEVADRDYLKLKRHFQMLAGQADEGYKTALREVRNDAATTPEGAGVLRQIWWAAKQAGFKPAYVQVIARNKFGNSQIEHLSLKELEDLRNTIMNRMRAKLGKGDTDHRNKKQTAQRRTKRQPEPEPPSTGEMPF